MKKILASLFALGCFATLVMAQNAPAPSATTTAPLVSAAPAVPDVVVNGFKEFKSSGYSAAINAWAHDSALMMDSPTLQALNNYFSQANNNAGTYVAADMIRVVILSPNTEIVYAVAKYQRQAVFLSLTCYKASDRWLVTAINANKDATKILPTNILGGQ